MKLTDFCPQNFSRGDTYNLPTAYDPDSDGTVVYSLDPTDPWFEVDQSTGQLRMREDCGQSCVKIQDCYYGQVTHIVLPSPVISYFVVHNLAMYFFTLWCTFWYITVLIFSFSYFVIRPLVYYYAHFLTL